MSDNVTPLPDRQVIEARLQAQRYALFDAWALIGVTRAALERREQAEAEPMYHFALRQVEAALDRIAGRLEPYYVLDDGKEDAS